MNDEVMVIHLLMVRPSMTGRGVASSFIKYAIDLAKNNSCQVLRLDTGSQNIPAITLYKKNGISNCCNIFSESGKYYRT